MQGYLLDTNACIAWMKNNPAFIRHLQQKQEEQIHICTPVQSELWFGACNSFHVEKNKQSLRQFFRNIQNLPFDNKAAECCGEVRGYLKKQGTPIGPYDLQIAAIALTHEMVLVTHNIKEFSRVPSLLVEDWQAV